MEIGSSLCIFFFFLSFFFNNLLKKRIEIKFQQNQKWFHSKMKNEKYLFSNRNFSLISLPFFFSLSLSPSLPLLLSLFSLPLKQNKKRYVPWSGTCRRMEPQLADLARSMDIPSSLLIAKISLLTEIGFFFYFFLLFFYFIIFLFFYFLF